MCIRDSYKDLNELTDWNLYSLQWAPVSLDGKWLVLQDKDLFDHAPVSYTHLDVYKRQL